MLCVGRQSFPLQKPQIRDANNLNELAEPVICEVSMLVFGDASWEKRRYVGEGGKESVK